MANTYDTVQGLLDDLLVVTGSADAVAGLLAGEGNHGLAAAFAADKVNELTDGSDDAHTAVYDWMVEHDAEGWDEDTADVDDDTMVSDFDGYDYENGL